MPFFMSCFKELRSVDIEYIQRNSTNAAINMVYVPPVVDEQSDIEDIDDEHNFGFLMGAEGAPARRIRGDYIKEYISSNDKEATPPQKKVSSRQSKYKRMSDFEAAWSEIDNEYTKKPINVEDPLIAQIVQQLGWYLVWIHSCFTVFNLRKI